MSEKFYRFVDVVARESAADSGNICYYPRIFANVALPVRDHKAYGAQYSRTNGGYTLSMISPAHIGLPYGTYPRLILSHLATQVTLSGDIEVPLGKSMSHFLKSMNKHPTGKNLATLNMQMKRLFSTALIWDRTTDNGWDSRAMIVANRAKSLWDESKGFDGVVLLSEEFFDDISIGAVPVDRRVLFAWSSYPLAFDLYIWLTYRVYKLHKPTCIKWTQLSNQFGNRLPRLGHFRKKFSDALDRVKLFYPDIKCGLNQKGILIYPSRCHIPERGVKKFVEGDIYPRI